MVRSSGESELEPQVQGEVMLLHIIHLSCEGMCCVDAAIIIHITHAMPMTDDTFSDEVPGVFVGSVPDRRAGAELPRP